MKWQSPETESRQIELQEVESQKLERRKLESKKLESRKLELRKLELRKIAAPPPAWPSEWAPRASISPSALIGRPHLGFAPQSFLLGARSPPMSRQPIARLRPEHPGTRNRGHATAQYPEPATAGRETPPLVPAVWDPQERACGARLGARLRVEALSFSALDWTCGNPGGSWGRALPIVCLESAAKASKRCELTRLKGGMILKFGLGEDCPVRNFQGCGESHVCGLNACEV